jgi:histidinol-phosphatase
VDPDAALRLAHDLADIADDISLRAFRRGLESGGMAVDAKVDGSPVTAADHEVERTLRRELRSRAPGTAFLGEEDGLDGPEAAPTWIVDPIDGTRNFLLGIPVFATLIALAAEGDGLIGVVTAPALGSRWDGVRGGAARQDGRVIRVSTVDRLEDAHICFGGLNYFVRGELGVRPVEALARRTSRQRGFGDFWQHCLVAAGAVDVAIECEVNRWDLAAPKVVVEAAGGRFTDLTGHPFVYGGADLRNRRGILACNARAFDRVLPVVREVAEASGFI